MAILGIDEVGRGPLAGPLVVGAVILPANKPEWVNELRDSKKLSVKKREELSVVILKEALACGLGWVSASEIDEVGISEALKLATSRAVKSVQELHVAFSEIMIDGKVNFLKGTSLSDFVSMMPKADDLVKEVSAASIIAKVARDHYMYDLASKYPGYGFEKHVGYGTAKHIAAISEFGITPEHRKSFEPIKSIVGFEKTVDNASVVKNTTGIGKKAEDAVANDIINRGSKILERNYRTKIAEIDIISVQGNSIIFTEVKYSRDYTYGSPLSRIDSEKQKKMRLGVEMYLKSHPEYKKYNPVLEAVAVVGPDFEIKDSFMIV